MSPIISGQVGPEGSKPLDPPQPGPSAADELAVGQPAFVSKKRSREGSDSHNENLHVEGRQSARKQNQPVDERAEPVGMAFGLNRPRDFEIMSSNPKWDPLFTWVKRSIGETKDSSIMNELYFQHTYHAISSVSRNHLYSLHA
ncbi:hypothetical protein Pst134EB_012457 [Puccinia striiformis f. sp. tritici]|nr:hypothetical protein Pst134EB_012457 [Puccinia striiformis f. sp. tritici]